MYADFIPATALDPRPAAPAAAAPEAAPAAAAGAAGRTAFPPLIADIAILAAPPGENEWLKLALARPAAAAVADATVLTG